MHGQNDLSVSRLLTLWEINLRWNRLTRSNCLLHQKFMEVAFSVGWLKNSQQTTTYTVLILEWGSSWAMLKGRTQEATKEVGDQYGDWKGGIFCKVGHNVGLKEARKEEEVDRGSWRGFWWKLWDCSHCHAPWVVLGSEEPHLCGAWKWCWVVRKLPYELHVNGVG